MDKHRIGGVLPLIGLLVSMTCAIASCSDGDGGNYNYDSHSCKVTFDTQGKGDNSTQWVQKGSKITYLPTPTAYYGFQFNGWYEEPQCSTLWDTSKVVNSDLTLYAKWSASEKMTKYLCFTAEENNSTITLRTIRGQLNIGTTEYSSDGINWKILEMHRNSIVGSEDYYYSSQVIQLHRIGDKVYLRSYGHNSNRYGDFYYHSYLNKFEMSGKISASGSIMSLIDTLELTDFKDCERSYFSYLFSDCTALIEAPELPATTLVEYCYCGMFSGCTSLIKAPKLPATTLSKGCYSYMFSECTSLTEAPELLSTILAENCYECMFQKSSLTTTPNLPATTLEKECYKYMFYQCKMLTQASTLPANVLEESCYWGMFNDCISLSTPPILFADVLAKNCCSDMFRGCTSLTEAPELFATELEAYCFSSMFYRCHALNKIKVHFENWGISPCTYGWLDSTANNGTFISPYALNATTTIRDGSHVPKNWNVVSY